MNNKNRHITNIRYINETNRNCNNNCFLLFVYSMPSCTSSSTNNKIKYNDKTEYEVCSVMEYIQNETNYHGGIIETYSCYSFTYIDSNGDIHTIDDFQNNQHGYTQLKIGKSNKYVIDGDYKYLYLTKETLNSLSSSQKSSSQK